MTEERHFRMGSFPIILNFPLFIPNCLCHSELSPVILNEVKDLLFSQGFSSSARVGPLPGTVWML